MNEEKKFLVMNVVDGKDILDVVKAGDVYEAIVQSTFKYNGTENVGTHSVYELKEDLVDSLVVD